MSHLVVALLVSLSISDLLSSHEKATTLPGCYDYCSASLTGGLQTERNKQCKTTFHPLLDSARDRRRANYPPRLLLRQRQHWSLFNKQHLHASISSGPGRSPEENAPGTRPSDSSSAVRRDRPQDASSTLRDRSLPPRTITLARSPMPSLPKSRRSVPERVLILECSDGFVAFRARSSIQRTGNLNIH